MSFLAKAPTVSVAGDTQLRHSEHVCTGGGGDKGEETWEFEKETQEKKINGLNSQAETVRLLDKKSRRSTPPDE